MARKNAKMTQKAVAELFPQCSRQSVMNWEAGLGFPSRERWPVLEQAFGLPAGWFLTLQSEGDYLFDATGNVILPALRVDATATYTPPASNVEPAEMPKRGGMVPLISSVRAGLWTAAEGLEPGEAEEWVDAPAGVGARAFALRVVGDSMEPRFQEGEIIIVDPDIEAASGDYVVASLEREDATLKRYLREGGRDWLVPQNQRYDPIDMTGRDWRIIGRVMEKRQKF